MTTKGGGGDAAGTLRDEHTGVPAPPPSPVTRDELVEWGRRFGESLSRPSVVALSGELGAGKTTLIQAICLGAGVEQDVTSPTFALVHEYTAPRGPVYHLDLYRLRGPDDLTNLGWDDIVNSGALVLIEWAERAGDRLPPDAVGITLSEDPARDDRRLIQVMP